MRGAQLSVLMPVYNAELFLKEAVESILNQTYSNFEFIIINDGSSDSSLDILKEFAKKDTRIRLISRPNKGLVKTLNEGLALIETAFVARMDADDISLPLRFEKQMLHLLENEDCLLLGTRVIIIDSDGDPICEMSNYFSHVELDEGLIGNKGQLIYHPSIIFRKNVVDQLGGYREKYPQVEDLDLFLRVSEIGKIENLKEPLLKYREHISKIGFIHSKSQKKQIINLIKEAHERRGKPYFGITETANQLELEPSISECWSAWSWLALKAGNIKTARKYAKMVHIQKPFCLDSWRLLLCSIRGY